MKRKWQIKLIKVGRSKITKTIIIEANTLPDAEQKALKECGKHLMSRDVELVGYGDSTYGVLAGLHAVGKVEIVSA